MASASSDYTCVITMQQILNQIIQSSHFLLL